MVLLAWLGIFAHAAWLVWLTVRGAARSERAIALPVAGERHDAEWYSRAADRAAAEGRLADALQLAFVALALTLEEQGRSTTTRARRRRSAPARPAWRRRPRAAPRPGAQPLRVRLRRTDDRRRTTTGAGGTAARGPGMRPRTELGLAGEPPPAFSACWWSRSARRAAAARADDSRRSTYLTGPGGASAFAEALSRLGVEVEHYRRPIATLAADSGRAGRALRRARPHRRPRPRPRRAICSRCRSTCCSPGRCRRPRSAASATRCGAAGDQCRGHQRARGVG